jgi:uncharacterized membrane protein YebE (DUF533 family)
MFDAKSILDTLVRGGGQQQGQQDGLAGISDLLKQLAGADQSPRAAAPADIASPGRARDRDDDQGSEERAPQRRPAMPREDDAAAARNAQGGGLDDLLRGVLGGQGGGLGDILGKLGQQAGASGGIADILKQVLGQATSGVKEGAGRIDEATGASRYARDAVGQATGRSPEEVLAQLKELIANNQLGAGAALGGLGTLVLGTRTGRSLAGSAIKLGGLALIGGLAYKAYQNYQQGQPPLAGGQRPPQQSQQTLLAAPEGSGFEPAAVTNDHATLLIRAMIAAAAADGRIDAREQKKILGGLQQAGLAGAAQQFLAHEIEKPATIDDLASAVSSQEEAVQVYTAARVAVDPDAEEEHAFLVALAERLGIDDDLAAHIDATARNAGT